ncbi:hypothetical protein ACOQH4_002813 [Yersinia enterocolitica]
MNIQHRFQQVNLLGQCRLRHAQGLCGIPVVTFLREHHKGFQQLYIHLFIPVGNQKGKIIHYKVINSAAVIPVMKISNRYPWRIM